MLQRSSYMKIIFRCIALLLLVLMTLACTGKDMQPLTQEEIEARKANQSEWERNAQRARGGP